MEDFQFDANALVDAYRQAYAEKANEVVLLQAMVSQLQAELHAVKQVDKGE